MADDLKTIVQRMMDAGESEQNIATVIQRLQPKYQPDASEQDMTARAMARSTGTLLPPRKQLDERGNEVGGMAEGPVKNFLSNAVQNPIVQGAAHPSSVSDLLSLVVPDSMGAGETSIPNLVRGTLRILKAGGQAAAEGPLTSSPMRFIRGVMAEYKQPGPPLPVYQRGISPEPLGPDLGNATPKEQMFAGTIGNAPAPPPSVRVINPAPDAFERVAQAVRGEQAAGVSAQDIAHAGTIRNAPVPPPSAVASPSSSDIWDQMLAEGRAQRAPKVPSATPLNPPPSGRLVMTAEEAQAADRLKAALRPMASLEGMKSAARFKDAATNDAVREAVMRSLMQK